MDIVQPRPKGHGVGRGHGFAAFGVRFHRARLQFHEAAEPFCAKIPLQRVQGDGGAVGEVEGFAEQVDVVGLELIQT